MVDGAIPGGPEVYTRPEIVEVLGGTSLGAAARAEFLAQLDGYSEVRRTERQEAAFAAGMVKLAVNYERTAGEGASDSNIEGWYEALETQSLELLRGFRNRPEVSEIEHSARNLAALLYVSLSVQAYREPDPDLLRDAGISEAELIEQCRGVLTEVAIDQGVDAANAPRLVVEQYPELRSLQPRIISYLWSGIISPMAAAFRADLLAAGYELPELDMQGMYPDENEDEY